MKRYILFETKSNFQFNYFIISLTYESVMSFIDEIIVKKRLNNVYVLFDTLLLNGEKNNRFELAYISNKKINIESFENISSRKVPKEIKKITYDFFYKNSNYLEFGVLTSEQKGKFIKKCQHCINYNS